MELETAPTYTVREMEISDIDEASEMRLQSWLDTYSNNEHGVSSEWIEARNARQRSDEVKKNREERFVRGKKEGTFNGWVACDEHGKVVGATTPYVDEDGVQHVGSLYVNKEWHGTGIASQLMQCVINWFNPKKPIVLGVVSYNERAKAFYRKWGFVETNDPVELFDGKIPEVHMVRKGDEQ